MIATDLAGTIRYWNRGAERLYGWTGAEAVGQNVTALTVTPPTAERAHQIVARLTKGGSWAGEVTVRRKDGSECAVHVADSPIRDDDGRTVGIIGVSYDITDRHRLAIALRESEERLRVVTDHLSDMVSQVTLDGTPEEDLRRQAAELERFNRLAVGRELRMIELKQQINALSRQLGVPEPYRTPDRPQLHAVSEAR